MRINVKVTGLDAVMRDFSEKGVQVQRRAEKVTETYARKMANESGAMAPVDSGDLRASILASPRQIAPITWEFGSGLAYARRQEYEHVSHRGFIRKSVWQNRNDYRAALRREIAK